MAGSQDSNGLDAPEPGALGSKPAAEDPRELARRLAAEAKARREAAKAAEDPRELARRLAAEAKAKREAAAKGSLASAAPPPGRVVADLQGEDEPKPAKKKRKKKSSLAAAAPPPAAAAAPKPSLAQRANSSRVLSAQEALAAALAAETAPPAEAAPAADAPPKKRKKRKKRPVSEAAVAEAAPAPVAAPAEPAPDAGSHDPSSIVLAVFSGATIKQVIPVTNRQVFSALWQAHRVRAVHEGDYGLVSAASVLIDASDRLPDGGLAALRVRLDERDQAMWVDTCRGVLLGIASPPEIYLAGL